MKTQSLVVKDAETFNRIFCCNVLYTNYVVLVLWDLNLLAVHCTEKHIFIATPRKSGFLMNIAIRGNISLF